MDYETIVLRIDQALASFEREGIASTAIFKIRSIEWASLIAMKEYYEEKMLLANAERCAEERRKEAKSKAANKPKRKGATAEPA